MPAVKHELNWIPENVAKIMRRNKINNRTDLAIATGLGRSTIYKAFNEDWSGTATHTVLAHIAGQFKVSLTHLVHEPRAAARQ